MTVSSLRNRLRRLEQRQAEADQPSIAERLQRARARWEALTPQQQAAERCRRVSEAVARLPAPEPRGDDFDARLERTRRRCGLRHLAAMASLDEPDLAEPPPVNTAIGATGLENWVVANVAWHDQQNRRAEARRYLADVALAGDLFKENP